MKIFTLEEYQERRRRMYVSQNKYYHKKKEQRLEQAYKIVERKIKELKGEKQYE